MKNNQTANLKEKIQIAFVCKIIQNIERVQSYSSSLDILSRYRFTPTCVSVNLNTENLSQKLLCINKKFVKHWRSSERRRTLILVKHLACYCSICLTISKMSIRRQSCCQQIVAVFFFTS